MALYVILGLALTACSSADEQYRAFQMTYTLQIGDGPRQVWNLDYRSSDDWTKTLVSVVPDGSIPVGRTATWDGHRIAWAESPDGRLLEDQSPEPSGMRALPEFWFGPGSALSDLPNDFWVEEPSSEPGTRQFRNESRPLGVAGLPAGSEPYVVQVITLDADTGIPVGYENTGIATLDIHFRATALDAK